jgi:hypothetical protein
MLLAGLAPVWAQPSRQNPGNVTERVLTYPKSSGHGVLDAVMKRLFGKAKCEKLAHTQSEVWSVPQTKMDRLKQRLLSLGVKFATLREGWNHILRRNTTPMSPAQAEALAKAGQSPETVGVGIMRAPEAAVAEYALPGGQDEKTSRIVIPISESQQVTVERDTVIRTDKGVIWRGVVEETGESAILLWWRDGRLTGVLGYKGHIYVVMNMGGDLHAVLEADPKRMPPDHPTPNRGCPCRRCARRRQR